MTKALANVILSMLLVACDGRGNGSGKGGDGAAGVSPIQGSLVTPRRDATYSLRVANRDQVNYALEIHWRDDSGKLCQEVVASVPAGSPESSSLVFQDVPAMSGLPYALVLKDPWGEFIDVQSLPVLVAGDFVPTSFSVDRGTLLSR